MDGLFIGDADTSRDPEFLDLNKISNLINTAGRQISNSWSSHGSSIHKLIYIFFIKNSFSFLNIRNVTDSRTLSRSCISNVSVA